ncbi:MAG: hypothetical protein E7525_02565 [Ruminococcaceae bacterium]|nr:hypothetical protein [Oscillospiraceae bacterium]
MKSFKCIAAMLLTLSLLLSFAGCSKGTLDTKQTEQPASANTLSSDDKTNSETPVSLEQLRKLTADKGAVCATAFIGDIEEDRKPQDIIAGSEHARRYPFLTEISNESFARQPGHHLYCIVPVDGNTSITVSDYDEADAPTVLGTIYEGKPGEAVFVCGNESDAVSNIHITVTTADKKTNTWVLSVSGTGIEVDANPDNIVYDFSFSR